MMHAAGPDHFQIAQGDSDVTDIRDVMTRGAMLFEESAFKYAGYENRIWGEHLVFWNRAERAVSETEIKTAETLNGLYTDSRNFITEAVGR